MYRRLLILLLVPTLAIVLLVGLVARSERASLDEADAVVHLAELASRAAALDTALGAETIAVADPSNTTDLQRHFDETQSMLEALGEHARTSSTSEGHIRDAIGVIAETLLYRSDATAGVISPLQLADRYATARLALRDAVAIEALRASPERRTADVSALLALVNARSGHIDERLAVALAVRYETWAPGQHSVVIGAIERQQIHLADIRPLAPELDLAPPPELVAIREVLLKGAELPEISIEDWAGFSATWSQTLTTAVDVQATRVSADARRASQLANQSLWLTMIAAAAAAVITIGTGSYYSLRLVRRIGGISDAAGELATNPSRPIRFKDGRDDELGELARSFDLMAERVRHASRQQRLEATALEAIVQKRPLQQILRTCNALVTERGAFEANGDEITFVDLGGRRTVADSTAFSSEPDVRLAADLVRMAQRRTLDHADLERRANFDSLTGLPNRALAIRTLEQICRKAGTARPGILFLDLDGFKKVNDEHGHDRGDMVLRAVASTLAATVADRGLVGRLGGDEFIVVVPDAGDATKLHELATSLRHTITQVSTPLGLTLDLSVGAALHRHGQDHDQLLTEADAAMYEAKGSSARVIASTPDLRARHRAQQQRERHLVRTLIDGEFNASFQPIWDNTGTRVLALEALARPVDGFGPEGPESFFADAERLGLARDFDRRMLRRVLERISEWRRAGLPVVPVAVNLSAQTLAGHTLVNEIEQLLAATNSRPGDLILEVTEDAIIPDLEATAERLEQLRALGIRIAIDDFGTGYSSLAYLARLPFDILKIDRQLVCDIDTNHTNRSIVETIVRLADVLGVIVVAEGIEREEERSELAAIGCSMLQGFLLSRPETARATSTRLAEMNRVHA